MFDFISWLGHASFRIDLSKLVYIDPWKIGDIEIADIVLISHPHHDHFNLGDLKKVADENTLIITVKEVAEQLKGYNVKVINIAETITVGTMKITAVPAYNNSTDFHPPEKRWVGFIVEDSDYTLYYAGDTDKIKEMKDLPKIDLALLPIGGIYTMNPEEAAEATALIHPTYVMPYHYGDIVGGQEELEEFKHLVDDLDPDISIMN